MQTGRTRTPPNQAWAENLAVSALTFLAQEPDRIGRFLALTGIAPHDIRAAAGEPGFLAAVLQHLLDDESLLLAFAGAAEVRPEAIAQAHGLLAGSRQAHEP
ncbi:DUF3572 domain-containing protein [Chelatococcus reniformis]|uniref:DUF3572 domain-containing protein n=1 Tax=Chelatococcus reniformis TaxID=1494448 RepID=A0A916XAX7_9HYPH|nr:DUF3572 domain-containing protein [Chelatococcus reniformis]GGC57347.1 hypothetical protein GCM10010994_15390 [Chelatococcus reniformis]